MIMIGILNESLTVQRTDQLRSAEGVRSEAAYTVCLAKLLQGYTIEHTLNTDLPLFKVCFINNSSTLGQFRIICQTREPQKPHLEEGHGVMIV